MRSQKSGQRTIGEARWVWQKRVSAWTSTIMDCFESRADCNRGVRPYGISLLIAGWDEHRGQSLYQVDPSGSYWAWKASAIGKNMVNGKTFLEKRCVLLARHYRRCFAALLIARYNDDLSLEDAIHTALLTLKEGFEGQMTEQTIEIGVVTVPTAEQREEKSGERLAPTFRKLSEAEVRDYLAL